MNEQERARRPLATPEQAAALASAVRLRIIRLTHRRPLTNKELAERLGKDPATVLHHVRRLVDTGFLEALPVRRGSRGSREIPYRSTGLSWRLDHRDAPPRAAMLQAFLGEVADAGTAELEQTRLVMELDEQGRAELTSRVQELVDEFVVRPAVDGSSRVALYIAVYPGE